MLVLSRKLQQQIKIGDDITVTVLRVKGNTVRIGVHAPRDVRVIRGELPKQTTGQGEEIETAAEIMITGCSSDEAKAELEAAAELNEESSVATEVEAASADISPAPARAPHLPLKRIRERFSAAPLKQVIAACPTLAK
jgi:carbon storage regulator CsrA